MTEPHQDTPPNGQEPTASSPEDSTSENPAKEHPESGEEAGSHGLLGRMRDGLDKWRKPVPGALPRTHFVLHEEGHGDDGAAAAPRPAGQVVLQRPVVLGFMLTAGVGLALLLFYVASHNTQLLLWIVGALFIALGLDPVVRTLEARKIPRPAGIVLVLLALLAVIGAFFATLIPTVVDQVNQIITQGPVWISDFLNSDFYNNLNAQFGLKDWATGEVQKFIKDSSAVGGLFGGIVGFGTSLANGLFGALIVLVLTLYFLAALPSMKAFAYRLAPKSRRGRVEELSEEITRSVGNYVIGQVCVALLNATFAFIVMSIVKVPFSVLLAFVVALLAFIPLVGGMIAGILVTLVALTAGWQTALIYAICYFAYLQFEAYFVSPRIMQKAVSVPGSVAVISVIAGGSLLGVLGALIAIPTAAAIMLLIKEVLVTAQDRK
ncbi:MULTISPECIES: AI-2E family transporter [Arthrobacter]|uniref:AI-2E family transporter n=2 Tax=Arthrobacter TaxID=1663 RepID=A0ABU9KND3_9MICC|nr:AI-2E family transporter [Arthrobacter sp. YJM1]MDP5228378.1 AI-2E family transporter [Arthrobacter sp. YJM1]